MFCKTPPFNDWVQCVIVKMANGGEETFSCDGSYADALEATYSLVAGLNKAEAEGFTASEESEEE